MQKINKLKENNQKIKVKLKIQHQILHLLIIWHFRKAEIMVLLSDWIKNYIQLTKMVLLILCN
jgi:hypothetical protein